MTDYAEKILEILEPNIGSRLAKSALKLKCKKLEIPEAELTIREVRIIGEELYEPLRIFAGDEFAERVSNQIKQIQEIPQEETEVPEKFSETPGISAQKEESGQ